jgi:hypothetical protein
MKKLHYFCLIGLFYLPLITLPSLATEEVSLTDIEAGKVVLPWTELKKLLEEIESLKKAAVQEPELPEPLPIDYSITKAHFEGEVKDNSVRFMATFTVQVLKTGWITIPFFSNEVGIESVAIDLPEQAVVSDESLLMTKPVSKVDSPPTQFVRNAEGYALFTKGPTTLTVNVTFYLPIHVEELTYTLSFVPPRAVINQVVLKIPEKGVNLIQKTAHTRLTQQENTTTIETVLSERDALNLQWKIEKDSGISRKSLATIHTLASVDKADIMVLNTIVLNYLNTLENIAFRLPKAVEILSVESLGIEQWSTEKQEKFQLVKLIGAVNPRTPVKIDLAYRLQLDTLPIEVALPTVEIIGIENLEGFLGVEALGNLEVTAKKVTDGSAIPAKNLPKVLWQKAANPLLYGYQFHKNTFHSALNIRSYEEIQTVVANVDLVDGVTHRTLEGKSITRILFFIRNNDRQFLTLTLPEHSHIWQAFLEGKPVKPAQKDSGEILIPMKKSAAQGEALQSFTIEIGYITEVNKLTLKGDIINQLPTLDIPVSYLRWNLYLPEYYEYSRFEGPLKQVQQFSNPEQKTTPTQIDIPSQGRHFLFEKYLIVDEQPYVRGQYGQFLGDDIFLSLHAPLGGFDLYNQVEDATGTTSESSQSKEKRRIKQQITPNFF